MDETKLMLTAIIERLDIQGAKLDALTMDVHKIKGQVTELQENVSDLQQNVSDLQQNVTNLQDKVSDLQVGVAHLDIRVSAIETRLDRWEATEKQRIADAQQYKAAQLRQEKMLELLSYRSVQQETEIAELRKAE